MYVRKRNLCQGLDRSEFVAETLMLALVTGASRGIGAKIAERLATDGHFVFVGFVKDLIGAERVEEAIRSKGGCARAIHIDVSSRESVRQAMSLIYMEGTLEILVNNAAIAQEKPFMQITDEDWDKMMRINLGGAFACSQEVLPEMIKGKFGRIVNITSIGGQWGGVNQIHYASSKAGLIGLTKSIAKTFAKDGITCNAVSPGLVATDMSAAELSTDAGKNKAAQIPLGRLGNADEVAAAVSFLAGPGGSYITGQTINVNGGMYFS